MTMRASHITLCHTCAKAEWRASIDSRHSSFPVGMEPECSLKYLLPDSKTPCRHSLCHPGRTRNATFGKAEVLCWPGSSACFRNCQVLGLQTHSSHQHPQVLLGILSFSPLFASLPGSRSWLRNSAVSKCCDLMGGNLLDSMYKFARGSKFDRDNCIRTFE